MNRREFLWRAAALTGGALTGWATPPARSGLAAGGEFLRARQSPDGAWRSAHYGAFRAGDALTPLILWALGASADDVAIARGRRWLERLTTAQQRNAEPWTGLSYPLFTASYAAQFLARSGDRPRAEFWAEVVERLQLSTSLGWATDDPACGAWSDASTPPQLPPGSPVPPDMLAPNVSATLLGVEALTAVGRHEHAAKARKFVERCQNFAANPEPPFDDGGFFFAASDPVRNKAGAAGCDGLGRERYRSYGSATCDGLLALIACGAAMEEPRVRAAFGWLRLHAAGAEHGGRWPLERTDDRESLRFYHAQAFAAVLAAGSRRAGERSWSVAQGRALAADLNAGQQPDGSWSGACPHSFEDDPLVATAFAVRALAIAPGVSS